MRLVVDVNVVLSSLWNKGNSFKVFAMNGLFNKFDFVAPEFLLTELREHKEEFSKKTKLAKQEFEEVLEFVIRQITFIPKSEFEDFLPKAKKLLSKHLKDVQYLALALKLDCPIFSGDKILRKLLFRTSIEVLPPKKMLKRL